MFKSILLPNPNPKGIGYFLHCMIKGRVYLGQDFGLPPITAREASVLECEAAASTIGSRKAKNKGTKRSFSLFTECRTPVNRMVPPRFRVGLPKI